LGIRRSLEKRGKPLAGANVASLRTRAQLARVHVFDHTLTQRGDSLGCHKQLLSWMKVVTLHHQDRTLPPATPDLSPGDNPQARPHSAGIAKRFSALAPLGSGEQVEVGLLTGAKEKS